MAETMTLTLAAVPEKRAELVSMMETILKETVSFDGCEGVEMWVPEDDAGKVIVLERWASRGHQEKYFAWRMQSGALESLGAVLTGPPQVTWFRTYQF